jgi:hypothetical protein
VCRIDCGDGEMLIVMFGKSNNNEKDILEDETFQESTTIPSVAVIAGIVATSTSTTTTSILGNEPLHHEMMFSPLSSSSQYGVKSIASSSYGVINPHECLYDHFSSLLETGYKGSDVFIQLDVETRPSLFGGRYNQMTRKPTTMAVPRYHVVRILGTEVSWDDCVPTVEVIRSSTDRASNTTQEHDGVGEEHDTTTTRPAKTTRKRFNAAKVLPTCVIPKAKRLVRNTTQDSDDSALIADDDGDANGEKTGNYDAVVTTASRMKPPPAKKTKTTHTSTAAPLLSPPRALVTRQEANTTASKAPTASYETAPAVKAPLEDPVVLRSPPTGSNNFKTLVARKTSLYDADDDSKSFKSEQRRQRKARECCYAPFCTKLAIECGGFMRGKCSEVL